jgi:hypothetical protein
MSGSPRLKDEEKQEMLQDAKNIQRGRIFQNMQDWSRKGTLDEYIDFLSENMGWFETTPTSRITDQFKL